MHLEVFPMFPDFPMHMAWLLLLFVTYICAVIIRTHCKFHCSFGRNSIYRNVAKNPQQLSRGDEFCGRHKKQLLTFTVTFTMKVGFESGWFHFPNPWCWWRSLAFSFAPARHGQSDQCQTSACIGHTAWEPLGCECCLFPALLQQNPRAKENHHSKKDYCPSCEYF